MTDEDRTFLLELLNTPSPSGFESEGQKKWMSHVRRSADSVESDSYGTAWATLEGKSGEEAPRVMIEAHADEIGFIVQYISDEGFISVTKIGGSDRAIARARRVRILADRGQVSGILGNTAIHIRDTKDEKVPEWHDLFVDIGARSRDEVLERGVRVGHPIIYADTAEELTPGRLVGRALDNRMGGYIIAAVMARLADLPDRPEARVYAVNAVQEEIGGNGARMVAYRLHPSVAIVLDVTHATDSPGIEKKKHGDVKLGGGPTLTHGSANHPMVVERLIKLAGDLDIPVQHEASSRYTGTDTDDIFVARSGIPSALISLPMRYMHSTVEMVDLEDVDRCVDLVAAFVQSVGVEDVFSVELG